jgi:hypothetical protein
MSVDTLSFDALKATFPVGKVFVLFPSLSPQRFFIQSRVLEKWRKSIVLICTLYNHTKLEYISSPTEVPYMTQHVQDIIEKKNHFHRQDIPSHYRCQIRVQYSSVATILSPGFYNVLKARQSLSFTVVNVGGRCMLPLSFQPGYQEKVEVSLTDYQSWLTFQLLLFFRPECTLTILARNPNRDIFFSIGEFFGINKHFRSQVTMSRLPFPMYKSLTLEINNKLLLQDKTSEGSI